MRRCLTPSVVSPPFAPRRSARGFTANYSPVAEVLTALERRFFGEAVFGYHFVNILLHALNTAVYKRFAAEGIEIPYPKRDVYLHGPEGES